MSKRSDKRFIQPDRDQQLLFPPSVHDYVPKDSLAAWLVRLLEDMDLSKFYAEYESPETMHSGRPPYDPAMMLALIFYCMVRGELSSRAMERMTYTDLGARYITGNLHPDHNSLHRFPLRHRAATEDLFAQLVLYCIELKLVKGEHWALDGTVIRANAASKNNRKVQELPEKLLQAKARVVDLLDKIEQATSDEERENFEEQRRKAERLAAKLEAAMARGSKKKPVKSESERPPRASAESDLTVEQCKDKVKEAGQKLKEARTSQGLTQQELAEKASVKQPYISTLESGRGSLGPDGLGRLTAALNLPEGILGPFVPRRMKKPAVEQINLTDNDAYVICKSSGFQLGYYGQATADAEQKIITAWALRPTCNERPGFVDMTRQAPQILGRYPNIVTADAGYASTENFALAEELNINLLCPPAARAGKSDNSSPELRRMREKLETPEGKAEYSRRGHIIEPVFSTIKEWFGMRQFRSRGLERVTIEWLRTVISYNLYRMFEALAAPLFGLFCLLGSFLSDLLVHRSRPNMRLCLA